MNLKNKQMGTDKYSYAIPVRITAYEFQFMFDCLNAAAIEYKEKFAAAKIDQRLNMIPVFEHNTVEDFTRVAMTNLATVSHGDVVLTQNNGTEISRIKANYQNQIIYNRT